MSAIGSGSPVQQSQNPIHSIQEQKEFASKVRCIALIAGLILLALASFIFLPFIIAFPLFFTVAIILTSLSYTDTGTHLFYRTHCLFFPPSRPSAIIIDNPAPPGGIYVAPSVPAAPALLVVEQQPPPPVLVVQTGRRSPPPELSGTFSLGPRVPAHTGEHNPRADVARSAAYQQRPVSRPSPISPPAARPSGPHVPAHTRTFNSPPDVARSAAAQQGAAFRPPSINPAASRSQGSHVPTARRTFNSPSDVARSAAAQQGGAASRPPPITSPAARPSGSHVPTGGRTFNSPSDVARSAAAQQGGASRPPPTGGNHIIPRSRRS